MKIFKILVIVVLVLMIVYLLSILVFRYLHNRRTPDQKLLRLEQKIQQNKNFPFAIIYMEDKTGKKSYHYGQNMNLDTPYYIASITKLFTHAIIFQLIDQGKINYHQSLADLIAPEIWQNLLTKDGKDYSADITIRNLIDQSSGLPDYETEKGVNGKIIIKQLRENDFEVTDQDALRLTRNLKARHLPNENKAYYSNLNAILLGMISEQVTSKSLKDLMQENILGPLNLNDTHILHGPKETVSVYSYTNPLHIQQYALSSLAPGGIVSTARDQMKFIQAFFEGGLFNVDHVKMASYRPIQFIPLQYGSGTMMMEVSPWLSPYIPAKRIVGHSGSLGSFAFYSPSKQVYIVGTFNQVDQHPFGMIYQFLDAWE